MGKQSRVIAQKVKVKQHEQTKKAKPVKTNLKRLNERVREKVAEVNALYEETKEKPENKQGDEKAKTSS